MADNTTLNIGTGGDVIATDDIGGVKHQRVKVEFGVDGVASDVSAANPLPVVITDGVDSIAVSPGGALSVLATAQPGIDIGDVTINNGGGAAAVNVQDGGNSLTVDGTVTANAGTGTFVVGDGGGSLTIDGTVTANAGTGTFVVGDGGSSISVDDNGSSLTVDGTVTANAGTGTFAVREINGTTSARTTNIATVDGVVLASNANRIRATFFNDADQDFLLGEGTTAVSSTNFTARIKPGGFYSLDDYTGEVRGFFTAALGSGRLLITEIT